MAGNIKPIPDNMTIEEASEFWDTHDVTDYPTRIVQFEYTPGEQITFIAIANQFLSQLEQQAKADGITIETLVNLWIQERLIA